MYQPPAVYKHRTSMLQPFPHLTHIQDICPLVPVSINSTTSYLPQLHSLPQPPKSGNTKTHTALCNRPLGGAVINMALFTSL